MFGLQIQPVIDREFKLSFRISSESRWLQYSDTRTNGRSTTNFKPLVQAFVDEFGEQRQVLRAMFERDTAPWL